VYSWSEAQGTRFSLSTDVAITRSFQPEQRYWAIGQTVTGHFHFSPKGGAYIWFTYFTPGKFTNNVTATAKSPSTSPASLNFDNAANVRIKQLSMGWKKYLKGTAFAESGWNIYGLAGFGLMLGTVENSQTPFIDTAAYLVPVVSGKGNFKRLTFDVALGIEKPVGADVFLYGEAKALVPTTDYPSKYLFTNNNAPFTASVNIGIRILF
jgi:hypothetical protein